MREVTITLWCDVHQVINERVVATGTHVITIDGSAPRQLDLCDEHRQDLLGLLAEYLVKYGVQPEAKKRATRSAKKTVPESEAASADGIREVGTRSKRVDRRVVCPECGDVLGSGGGASSHIKKRHGEDALAVWRALTPEQRAGQQ